MRIAARIFERLTLLARCREGVAYVEFALCISVLLMFFLGSIELTRYVLILQHLENTVDMVADVTTQTDPNTDPLTSAQMLETMNAVTDMMNPYTAGVNDPSIKVIVTDVTQAGTNNPVVNWQYCGGGTFAATSKIGTVVGNPATLPAGFAMNAGEEVVIGEIFYSFVPITHQPVISSLVVYKTSIYMPRLGTLTGFSSHC